MIIPDSYPQWAAEKIQSSIRCYLPTRSKAKFFFGQYESPIVLTKMTLSWDGSKEDYPLMHWVNTVKSVVDLPPHKILGIQLCKCLSPTTAKLVTKVPLGYPLLPPNYHCFGEDRVAALILYMYFHSHRDELLLKMKR